MICQGERDTLGELDWVREWVFRGVVEVLRAGRLLLVRALRGIWRVPKVFLKFQRRHAETDGSISRKYIVAVYMYL